MDGWDFRVCQEMILISREKGDDEPMSGLLARSVCETTHSNDDETPSNSSNDDAKK